MKNYYYYLFVLFSFNMIAQTQTSEGSTPSQPTNQASIGNESTEPSSQTSNLLYSEIFTPRIGTPNSGGFKQVNFSNVGEYTGTASTNVPIYQIQVGQINIPIELNYSSTGIKVDETASNVGQNWSLNAGGIVTKVIKGIEDFKVTIEGPLPYDPNNHKLKFSALGTNDVLGMKLKEVGWLMQNTSISLNKYYDIASTIDKIYTLPQMEYTTTKKDLSPDLFYVNAPGLNTSFTHKKDQSVMEIAFQGNRITTTIGQTSLIPFFPEFRDNRFELDLKHYDGGSPRKIQGVTKIEVTNINGTQYLFDQLDVNQYVSREILQPYKTIGSSRDLTSQEIMAYKLSSIKDFKGNEVIFTYEKYAINYPEYRKTADFSITNIKGDQLTQNLSSTEIRYPNLNRISKISYAEGIVEFKYEEPRKDLPGDYALSRIIVKDLNANVIKTIKLEYDYITSNNNCSEPTCKRLRLLTVQEIGQNNIVIPPYRFFYNDDIKLPERGASITDYLGYANGPVRSEYNNITSISCMMCLIPPPELYYKPNQKDFSISPFPIFTNSFVTAGRSLKPSLVYTKAGVLTKVQYPTGGSEEFEYELNDFYSALTGQNVQSGGLRVSVHKLVDTKGALQVHKYNYLNSNGKSSGILNNLPVLGIAHAYNEQLAATYLGLSSFSLESGLILHTFTNSATDFDLVEGSNVGYSRVLIKENADNGYTEKIFSTRKDFPVEQPLFTYKAGDKNKIEFGLNNGWRLPTTNNTELLIGKLTFIRKYDKLNNLVEETKNSYQYDIFNQITDKVGISRRDIFPGEVGVLEPIAPDFAFYPSVYSSRNLTSETKTVTKFNQNEVENITTTIYDLKYQLPKSTENIVNQSGDTNSLITRTSYPHDFSTSLMLGLANANRIAEPVVIKNFRKTNQSQEELNSQEILYDTFTRGGKSLILPKAVQTVKGAQTITNPFEEKIQFHDYDKFGNSIESSKKDDIHTVYLWGYNYTKPIAKIENTTYSEVMISLGRTNSENLEYLQSYDENQLKTEIQKVRDGLNNAMVTSYIYKPLIGISTIVDQKNNLISYEYDDLNRLKKIKDQDQNVIEEYCYGYTGVLNDCQNDAKIPVEIDNSVYDSDLQVIIGDYKSYKIPIACNRGVSWENYLPDGAEYKGRNILSLHDELYFPNPAQTGVHYTPGYYPLPVEYTQLPLPYPVAEYTCNYFAERFGYSFNLSGLDNPKFLGPDRVVDLTWWMEIDGKKIELPQVQEYKNIFFIPKCLDGIYGRIICSAKITSGYIHQDPARKTITYTVKSNLIKFKSGQNDYDNLPALYKLSASGFYSGDVCSKTSGYGIGNNSGNVPADPGYWDDAPWLIDNGTVTTPDFKISVDNFKMHEIPVPAFLPETFTWTGLTKPSLHPLFDFPRPIGGIHNEESFTPHTFPSYITFPYMLEYYTDFYVTRGGYRFNSASVIQKVADSRNYTFNWYLKIETTGQQIPLIRTLESKDLFFIPPSLNGKKGKLICIATKRFDTVATALTFESEIITFQQGLLNTDNLNYQADFLDEVGL